MPPRAQARPSGVAPPGFTGAPAGAHLTARLPSEHSGGQGPESPTRDPSTPPRPGRRDRPPRRVAARPGR